jgi:Fe-S cluster assembly ATP-binding protein
MPALLTIKNLRVSVENKEIIKGLDLKVGRGEIHALMGPNGSGKSTLAQTLMGHPSYIIKSGRLKFAGLDITEANPETRAAAGLFLAWQYPPAVPGLQVEQFLRTIWNTQAKTRGDKILSAKDFHSLLADKVKALGFKADLLERSLNDGFSGGEKKRFEILQLMVLRPKLAILDETDSGLDLDALKMVIKTIKQISSSTSVLIITHYPRLLKLIKPDYVHVMLGGRLVDSGGGSLVSKIERLGFAAYKVSHGAD